MQKAFLIDSKLFSFFPVLASSVDVASKSYPGFQLSPFKTAQGLLTFLPEKGHKGFSLPCIQDDCRKAGQLCVP